MASSTDRPGPGQPTWGDVVFTFSFESLEDAARRGMGRPPDRLVATLIRDQRVRRLIVADSYRSVPAHARRRLSGSAVELPGNDNYRVRPVRVRRRDPASLAALARTYRRYEARLRRAVVSKGLEGPVVITFNPFVAAFCDLGWARRVTYYARDDWSTYPVQRRLRHAHEDAIVRIRDRGHQVCAVSQVLLDRIAPTGPSIVIPNGIDPEEWVGEAATPDWYGGLPRPIAVYAGSLDGRLDVEAVRQVAEGMRNGSVVLLGPVMDRSLIDGLAQLPNVHIPGRHPRSLVAGMIRTADVCLIPHVHNELTTAMSPLKLFEYLAGGRPVVATDLPPIRREGGRTVLVSAAGDWSSAVHEALTMGLADEEERLAYVDSHSWSSRHEDVLRLALGEPQAMA